MSAGAPDSYEWHEDDTLDNHLALGSVVAADQPQYWSNYDRLIAGIPYSGLWLLESWTSGGSVQGYAGLIHMAYGLTTLLLALTACTAMYKALARHSERLAGTIVAVSSIAMFVAHRA